MVTFLKSIKSGNLITKRIIENELYVDQDYVHDISKTILLNKKDIDKFPDLFGISFFQERINKKFEIRVIYFNKEFYSAAIFGSENNIDIRIELNQLKDKPRIIPFSIPYEIRQKLLKLMNFLEFDFASIDLLYDENEKFIFLEINPCGQIGFINEACNFNLDFAFAEYLIKTDDK